MTDLDRSELTRWVAEHVMGWPIVMFYDDDRRDEVFPRLVHQHPPEAYQFYLITGDRKTEGPFDPTTKIEHAWLLVDRMREMGYLYRIQMLGCGDVTVMFWSAPQRHDKYRCGDSTGPEACLAITTACRAALEAQG